MQEALARVFDDEPRIAYALVYGSVARNTAHAGSDLDVAVGLEATPGGGPRLIWLRRP